MPPATSESQPQEFDAVLGNSFNAAPGSVVLGGIENLRQKIKTGKVKEKIVAIQAALTYGHKGIALVIQALDDRSPQVKKAAYQVLRDCPEAEAQQAVQAFCPYPIFECLSILQGHQTSITAIAIGYRSFRYRPAQLIAASASRDGQVNLWDLVSAERCFTLKTESIVQALAIDSNSDSLILSTTRQKVIAWSLKNGQELEPPATQFRSIPSVTLVGKHPYLQYQYLLSGSRTSIKVWELETGKELAYLNGHTRPVTAIALDSTGLFLISGCKGGTVRLWGVA